MLLPLRKNGLTSLFRKRAEYGFGEHGFKHRTQWVFLGLLSSGERTQWVPLSLLFVCQSELTEFLAELTEFAPKLSEAQWVLFSETVLSKQYSARFRLLLLQQDVLWFNVLTVVPSCRSSKWHYRQRKIIFALFMRFIVDADTDENDFGINFS